jgi:hypothetical protein
MYSPNAEWLRTILKSDFEDIIFDENAITKELFNMDTVKGLWKLHTEQNQDYSFPLMMMLQFELWYKIFINKLL